MTIQEKAELLIRNIYEMENGVNLYGHTPKDHNTTAYKKTKVQALRYTKNSKLIILHNYIKSNF